MSKNAFNCKAAFLALCLFSIPSLQLSATSNECAPETAAMMKLLRICAQANAVTTPGPPSGCTNADIYMTFDESCTGSVPVAVFLTNIDDNPNSGGNYDLPPGVPPIHLRYEYSPGNWLVTEELTEVIFKGTIEDEAGEDIHIFGIDVFLDTYQTTDQGCEPGQYRLNHFTQSVEVVTPTPWGYSLYPVLLHSDVNTGIFSCEVFHETACMCGSQGGFDCSEAAPPSYNYAVCVECDCEREGESLDINPIDITTAPNKIADNILEITPNPFNDFVEVQFQQEIADTQTNIKIYSTLGELVYSKDVTLSKGSNRFTIGTSNLSPGTYYFIFNDGDGQHSKKMILIDK